MAERSLVAGKRPLTVRETVRQAAARLKSAGCEAPRLDAELLLCSVLGCDRAQLVLEPRLQLEAEQIGLFERLLARRESREPLAYIVGWKEFRGISLRVDRRALIPRPETELLVEVGLTLPAGATVVDVGTGSGAVALALKHERPDLKVVGSDIDTDALEVARHNGAVLGLEVRFLQADLLAGMQRAYDAVLANLPYVSERSTSELAPEISRYEPRRALFAGPDGLEVIRRLMGMVQSVPLVALEVAFDQADRVESLLRARGFSDVERLRDLAGHERVLVARR